VPSRAQPYNLILVHFKLGAMIINESVLSKSNNLFSCTPHYTIYILSGCVLERIRHVDDLGVYMDPKT